MEEMCDESGRLDPSLAVERETSGERKLETAMGGTGAMGGTSAEEDEQLTSSSAQKIPEAVAEDTEAERSGGSRLRKVDHTQRNADLRFPLDALTVHEDMTPGALEAAGILEQDCVVPAGAYEAPSGDCGPVVVHGGDEPQFPNEQTWKVTEIQDVDDSDCRGSSSQIPSKKTYDSVLHQILQQQKHKPGRRFKKKTLMKMAKLFVIAKEWDSKENKSLTVAEMLHHKDLFASIASQTETNSAEAGRSETLSPMIFNRKSKSDSKKTENQKSDCTKFRKSPDGESRLQTASDEPKRLSDISSASAKEGTTTTCDDRELPRNEAAETSGIKTSKPKKRAAKAAEAAGNKRAKQKRSDETSAENDVRQDTGLSARNEDEAAREGPREHNKTAPKVKKKPGRMIRKKTQIPTEMEAPSGGNRRRKKMSARLIQSTWTAADGETASITGGEAVSSQTINVDHTVRVTENKTQQRVNIQRTRKKKVPASTSQQAAHQLQAGDVSRQGQNKPDLDGEAAPPTKSRLQRKPAAHRKTRNRKPSVDTPVCNSNDCPSIDTLEETKTVRRNPKPQRRRAAWKGKVAETFNIKEESQDFSVHWAAFGLKQEEDEQPITIANRGEKGGVPRRRKKDGAVDTTVLRKIKNEPLWEAATTQPDFPLMDIKTEPVQPQTQTQAFKTRKSPKYAVEDASWESTHDRMLPCSAAAEAERNLEKLASDVGGISKQKRRRQRGKLEVHITSVENPQNTEEEDESKYEKLRQRKLTLRSNVTALPEEYLIRYLKGSWKRSVVTKNNPSAVSNNLKNQQETTNVPTDEQHPTSDTPNPKNTSKLKYKRKGRAARGRKNPPADGEPTTSLPADVAASSLLENVSGDIKDKRTRTSGSAFKEEVHPPDSVELNPPTAVILGSKKRRQRSKRKLDSFTSSGGQTELTPEMPDLRSTADRSRRSDRVQKRWSKRLEGKSTPQMEGATPDLKDAFEFECKASTSEVKPDEEVKKKMTLLRAEILESSSLQRKYEAEAPEDRGTCKTSRTRRKIKIEDVTTMKTQDAPSHPVDLNAIKQEPDEKEPSYVPSAPPAKKIMKRRRRSKTHWVGRRKVKRPRISSLCCDPADVESSSLNSSVCELTSPDETINLRLEDQQQQQEVSTNVTSEPRNRPLETLKSQKKKKKNLRCPFCRRCFRHISAFTLHKRIHTGEKPFRCPTCGRRFTGVLQLNLHSKVHREPPALRCPCCDGTFQSKAELILHFKTHLNDSEGLQTQSEGRLCGASSHDEVFKCSRCLKEFTEAAAFEKHRQTHGGKLNRKRFGTPSNLGFHQKTRPTNKEYSLQKLRELKRLFKFPSGPTTSSCNSELTASSRTNQTTAVCSDRTEMDGFLAPRGGDTATVVLKCPICKQHHHHWCHYVQHLQIHRCQACRQQFSPVAGKVASENPAVSAPSPARLSANFDVNTRSPNSRGTSRQPSAFRLQLKTPKLSGRFLCGRCGKCFPRWNKLWLHQRLHRRVGRPFRCSTCELEFHFLGSYVDHLREHAAQTPHACPSCPDTFADQKSLSSHVSNCHKHQERLKCSTCGKCFSSLGNLQKHKLLHRSAKSHACLPCGLAFSCHAALTHHLEIHRRRLSVPQPAPVTEPFLFPYCCRKCTAKFSSAELLQAHQVCHFTGGNRPESPPESIASFIPSRAPGIQGGTSESSGRRRQLPVSNKKHLFRYPDPNRLYVVPVISSEPPIIVQDSEEENLSIAASADDQSGSPLRKPGAGVNSRGSGAPRWLNVRGHGSGGSRELKFLVQSLLPEKCSNGEIDAAERAPSKDVHICTTCTASFTDIKQLHTHYVYHARGV